MLIICGGNYLNSGGRDSFAQRKMLGKGKEMNPRRDEFPDGLDLQKRLKRSLLIGLVDLWQDLPDPQAQNSPQLVWRKENEFRPNCHFGDRLNRTTSVRTE